MPLCTVQLYMWGLVRIPSALASAFHFSALSSEPIDEFDQTCIDTLLGEENELIRFC